MILPDKVFPNHDVDLDAAVKITQLWGRPRPVAQNVLSFLAVGEMAVLRQAPMLRAYLTGVINVTGEMMNGDKHKMAAVRLGAVFYGSVFAHFHGTDALRADRKVILDMADREGVDVVLDSKASLEDSDTDNFRRMLGMLLPTVEFRPESYEASLIGAGAVHLVVMEDQKRATSLTTFEEELSAIEDPFAALEGNPDLADLRKLFEQLDNE